MSPGYIDTDMTVYTATPAQVAHMRGSFARVPQHRLIRPEEIAAAFLFLASDAASGIAGTTLTVDGGLTANLYIQEILPRD